MKLPLALLLLSLTPLLMAVSCAEPQPPDFETSDAVIRGNWAGKLRQSGEVLLEFRLQDVQAQRTGPDSYSFAGDAYFGLDQEVGSISGTATTDPPLAGSYQTSGTMTPQMSPPKGARHTVSAKLIEPDGVEWDLETWAYELDSDHYGYATGTSVEHARVSLLHLDQRPHVMGLAAKPPEIRSGEAYDVAWLIWTKEEQPLRCLLELPSQPVVELDDCGSGTHRISTSFPDIDPEPSEPESFPIELTVEWGEGFERSTVTRSEIVVLPGP